MMFIARISFSLASPRISLPSLRNQSTLAKPIVSPSILNLRIGKIIKIDRHENADKLYVSQISISPNEENPEAPTTVQVCSGLVDYIPQSKLLNSKVILVMNLKPSKMRGVKSEAMLLAASSTSVDAGTKVEIVSPPRDVPLGTRVYFKGFEPESNETIKRVKSSQWDAIAKGLKTDEEGRVVFNLGTEPSILVDEINLEGCTVETLKNSDVR
ncbi:hypothetical protein CANARDRAFT_229611 [[Candida] arabinofermentans NRRL YB-2248]|uniref:tRNA-binding domain-containing protein n=1 Tax=[Candida] arabinofermentans NRRL YB-2248 TaxID=983967 RepID=A0A1E4T672_9ASCO|nr:hypothetical protein CANARDRAFT_229611 [[Candida] arabinofermentans NRRL YB-2248]